MNAGPLAVNIAWWIIAVSNAGIMIAQFMRIRRKP